MADPTPQDWLRMAREEGVDPAEVRLVLSRYQAYLRYYQAGRRGDPLPLETWFNWFHVETTSEVQQNNPTASGCSVDPNAQSRGAISRPVPFLKVLAALVAVEAVV